MKRRKNNRKSLCFISVCFVILFALTVSLSAQISFEKQTVTFDSAERQTALLTGFFLGGEIADIAVFYAGEKGEKRLKIYSFDEGRFKPKLEAQLRTDVQFADAVRIGGRDRIVTHEPGRLNRFDPATANEIELLAVTTNLEPLFEDGISAWDISRDVNGDGLDDLVIPEADGFNIFMQMKNGTFSKPLKIGKSVKTDAYHYNPWIQAGIHEIDFDRDGRKDLVYWDEDRFRVHLQNENGSFDGSAGTFTTEIAFDSDDIKTLAAPFGVTRRRKDSEPEGKLTGRVLYSLSDMNGDGVADMVIFSLQGGSLFKMFSTFEIHFGRPAAAGGGGMVFSKNFDAVIRSEGIPFAVEKHDFDGDGQRDVMFTTINPSFFKIARMLVGWFFTRSVPLDLKLYRMKGGRYQSKPDFKRKIKTISLGGSGEEAAKFPAILFGDLNGDKRPDLLVQKGTNQLQIFPGEAKPDLFARRPQKIKVSVPKNKNYTWLKDLNSDGREDILMYHRSAKMPHRLTILLVR